MTKIIETVNLTDLTLSALNPRQSHDAEGIAALAQSIRTIGLIQPLAGLRRESGAVEIVAGGRRLAALHLIANEADNADQIAVPVNITETENIARAWATTENIAREALRPAQEIRAYRDMRAGGADNDTIARAFSVTTRHVAGRLRLADLPEPILSALDEGEISLDAAAAFTVSDDPDAQMAVFKKAEGSSWLLRNPREIKAQLTESLINADSRIGEFVSRAAYEAAGGDIREDLFGEGAVFLDTELAMKLAGEKLDAAREAALSEGWKWAEARIETPCWSELQAYDRIYGDGVLTEAEADRMNELCDKCDALTEEEETEWNALDAKSEAFTPEQKEGAGVILSIDHDGDLRVTALIHPNDLLKAPTSDAQGEGDSADTAPAAPTYSQALRADLTAIRTAAIQTALLSKPELALDLLAWTLTLDSPWSSPLKASASAQMNRVEGDEGLALPEALGRRESRYLSDGASDFAAFRALGKKERNASLTASIARAFGASLSDKQLSPMVELIAELSGAKPRTVWSPTDAFLTRLNRTQLLNIFDAVIADDAARKGWEKAKKGELVEMLRNAFAGTLDGMTAEQKARAAAWEPEGFEIIRPEVDDADEIEDEAAEAA